MRASTPARFCFSVCACVCAGCSVVRACVSVRVCYTSFVYVLLLLCACVRGLPCRRASAKFLKNTRRFRCLHPSPRRSRFRVSRVRFSHFFFFFRPATARSVPVKFSVVRCFRCLWFVLILLNFVLFVYRLYAVGGPSDPSTLNIVINNNNNNKYHALRAGVNNRQVGHRASAKKFLLFTERDILRCVYRSAKRSVYTNFMFAFF